MTVRWKPPALALLALAGFVCAVAPRANAQAWANNAYRYRAPLTITNPTGATLGAGDVVAYSFVPNDGVLEGKTRSDSKDVRVYYWNGASNVDVGQVPLEMSSVAGKILFQLGAPLAPGNPSPFTKGTDGSAFNLAPANESDLNIKGDDLAKVVPLGITFPFLGQNYTQAVVSSNGWISFETSIVADTKYGAFVDDPDKEDTENTMLGRKFIAPFSGDLDTSGTGAGVFQSSDATSTTFRWAATKFVSGNAGPVTMNFSLTLFTDGRVRFNYGPQAGTQVSNEADITANGSYTLDNTPVIGGTEVVSDTASNVFARDVQYVINNVTGVVSVATAVIPNGTDVRTSYKYASGVTCAIPDNHSSPALVNVGMAVGNAYIDLLDRLRTPQDFGGRASILYTPQVPTLTTITPSATDPGYYVYYGNPADTGSRTGVPSNKLIGYTFDSGDQGWVSLGSATLESGTYNGDWFRGEKALKVGGSDPSDRYMAFAQSQTANLADVTLFAKGRGSNPPAADIGSGEMAMMVRADDQGNGYGLYITGLTTPPAAAQPTVRQAGLMKRSVDPTQDYRAVSTSSQYDTFTWTFFVLEASGSGTARLRGKVFQRDQADPAGFEYDATVTGALPAGKLGVTGFGGGTGGSDAAYVDWVYAAANAFADSIPAAVGAEEILPLAPGQGLLQGLVSDNGISTALGYAVPMAGISVTITGPASYTLASSELGSFSLYVPAGNYTIQYASSGYTSATKNVTVPDGGTGNADQALDAINLVANPGFETADPSVPSVKPRGWYRKTYDYNYVDYPNPSAVTAPWGYVTSGGANVHSGNRSISIAGSNDPTGEATNIIAAWQVEGKVTPVVFTDADGFDHSEPDGRGNGPAPPTIRGEYYLISAWVKKTGDSGEARLRIRDLARDDDGDASRIDGGTNGITVSQGATTDWKQLSVIYKAASNFLSVRLYGVDIPSSQPMYWDDVVVSRVSQPTFRGTVKKTNGDPVAFAGVGVHETGATAGLTANGLSDPAGYDSADALGRYAVAFVPKVGVGYQVQALKDTRFSGVPGEADANFAFGYKASANVPLTTPTAKTDIIYDPAVMANIAYGRPVVSFSTNENSTNRPGLITDGNQTVWRSNPATSGVPRGYPAAQYVIIDLGQSVNFNDIEQISLAFRQEVSSHWQIRASNVAPSGTLTGTGATTYGTLIYDSPNVNNTSHPIQESAGPRSYSPTIDDVDYYALEHKVITKDAFRNKPTLSRYINFVADQFYAPYTAVQVWEIRVEVPGGTITGKVVDKSLNPLASARVVGRPADSPFIDAPQEAYVLTDTNGVYTINYAPTIGTFNVMAHLPTATDANAVYAVTPPLKATLVANATTTLATIGIGDPAPSLVSSATASMLDGTDVLVPETPPANAADKSFATQWQTQTFGDVPPAPVIGTNNPLRLDADLGGSKTFNTIIVNWTNNFAPTYSIQTSTDGSTFTTQYATTVATTGYGLTNVTGDYRGVDALTFATPITATKVRILCQSRVNNTIAAWEVQVANAPQFTPPANVPGDVNKDGNVTSADVLDALRVAAGLLAGNASSISFQNLDVNADGQGTLIDAVRINRFVNGKGGATP